MNWNIDLDTILYYLTSGEIQAKILPVKIAFLAISAIFLAGIVFLLLKTHWLQWLFFQDLTEFVTRRPFGAKKITGTWNKILNRLVSGAEAEWKLAVIEADDMFDGSLKKMGYAGQNLEERLQRLTGATLPNIDQIHAAHQTRNNIVHNPDFRLSLDEARKTLEIYGQAFKDLQILD